MCNIYTTFLPAISEPIFFKIMLAYYRLYIQYISSVRGGITTLFWRVMQPEQKKWTWEDNFSYCEVPQTREKKMAIH